MWRTTEPSLPSRKSWVFPVKSRWFQPYLHKRVPEGLHLYFPMIFLWIFPFSHGFTMVFLWFGHFPLVFPWNLPWTRHNSAFSKVRIRWPPGNPQNPHPLQWPGGMKNQGISAGGEMVVMVSPEKNGEKLWKMEVWPCDKRLHNCGLKSHFLLGKTHYQFSIVFCMFTRGNLQQIGQNEHFTTRVAKK